MAKKVVEKYQVGWNHTSQVGFVVLIFEGGRKQVGPLSYEDYSAMVDILRNEEVVLYDEDQALLATFLE